MAMKDITPAQALTMLAKTTMRPFDQCDWQAFSGCESDEPLIGEFDLDTTLILDGDVLNVLLPHNVDTGGQLFKLREA